MFAQAYFDAAATFPVAGPDQLLGDGGAVIVAPHPDDESLGCGALIASARREGRRIAVVVLSDGTGSHPNSKSYPPPRLQALREAETLKAAAVLGVARSDVHFFGLCDRFVPTRGPKAERCANAIVTLMRIIAARSLFVTWRHDPHCDHRAAFAMAREAASQIGGTRLFEYPVWGHTLPPDTRVELEPRGWRFDGSSEAGRKRAAIACHRSQTTDLINDDPQGFRLNEEMLRRFDGGEEIFFECGS